MEEVGREGPEEVGGFVHETTRLAPSPTGALHLGNARTFLVNWALARKKGWKIVLRIEDLDGPRIKPQAVQGIVHTLKWLGLGWDEGPFIQSQDLAPYLEAMRRLAEDGKAFPCSLTRGQIAAAASAPQEGAHELPYPQTLRPKSWERALKDIETNWRFVVPGGPTAFEDHIKGKQSVDCSKVIGDFIVWTKRATPAYQLAVVVDDHRQGITQVVRGDDLLDSAARQLLIYRALGLSPEPSYWHLPLVVGPDGKRLSKRHGDTRLEEYHRRGVKPEAVVGWLAKSCGAGDGKPMNAKEFMQAFEPARLPSNPVVFTAEDDNVFRR